MPECMAAQNAAVQRHRESWISFPFVSHYSDNMPVQSQALQGKQND